MQRLIIASVDGAARLQSRYALTTLREIAEALNARGVQTARGGVWHAMTVKNLMDRPASA